MRCSAIRSTIFVLGTRYALSLGKEDCYNNFNCSDARKCDDVLLWGSYGVLTTAIPAASMVVEFPFPFPSPLGAHFTTNSYVNPLRQK